MFDTFLLKIRTFLLLIVIATFAAATNSQSASAANMGHRLQQIPERPTALDFTLYNLSGEKVQLSDFQGKVVVVNFWATWCPPCRSEIPSMRRAWEQIKKENVVMLAVHVGGKLDKVRSFAEKKRMEFPVLFDADCGVARSWPTKGYPTTFILDPEGRIAYKAVGGREWDSPKILQTILELRRQS